MNGSTSNRNNLKGKLRIIDLSNYAQISEIRFVHLGQNIGFEQNGRGKYFVIPVIILGRSGNLYQIIPLTKGGKDIKYYWNLPEKYFDFTSRAILTQIRSIDGRRLKNKVGRLDENDFLELKEKLRTLLF